MSDEVIPSTRPYLVRAIFKWCLDSGFTPYLTVADSPMCRLPKNYVKGGFITLNISESAAPSVVISEREVLFQAKFDGVVEDIVVPIGRVVSIYARENGQGLHFTPEDDPDDATTVSSVQNAAQPAEKKESSAVRKSWLRVIK